MKRLLFLLFAITSVAQSQIAIHVIFGSTLPSFCSPLTGDVFFLTTGGAGVQGLYSCDATNTWVFHGNGGTGVDSVSGSGPITATGTGAVTVGMSSSATLPGTPSVQTAPTNSDNSNDIASTNFVRHLLASLNPAASVAAGTTTVLPNTPTYNNSAGTLTAASNGALTIDGYSTNLNDRLLIKNQASAFQNGVYSVTTLGSGSVSYVLTRTSDFNTVASINNAGVIPVLNGTVNNNTTWVLDTAITTLGTSSIIYDQTNSQPPVTTVNGVTFSTASGSYEACINTSATACTWEKIPNVALANSATTVNGQTCTLGSTCTISTSSNPNGYGMWQLSVPSYSSFNWYNQSSASDVTGTNFLSILGTGCSGSTCLNILHQACPSGFTSGTEDLFALVLVSGSNGYGQVPLAGIEVDDGTKIVGLLDIPNNTSFTPNDTGIFLNTYTSATGTAANVSLDNNYTQIQWPIWLRLHDASGTISGLYSFSGVDWRTLGSTTTGGLSSVANCGFFASGSITGQQDSVTILSWQFASSLTPQ